MHFDTDSVGTGAFVIDWVEGGDSNWPGRFKAELRAQLDAGATLFGDDADGGYWAITKHGRRRVVPGTDGQVAAAED